jgi:hypothetical protein
MVCATTAPDRRGIGELRWMAGASASTRCGPTAAAYSADADEFLLAYEAVRTAGARPGAAGARAEQLSTAGSEPERARYGSAEHVSHVKASVQGDGQTRVGRNTRGQRPTPLTGSLPSSSPEPFAMRLSMYSAADPHAAWTGAGHAGEREGHKVLDNRGRPVLPASPLHRPPPSCSADRAACRRHRAHGRCGPHGVPPLAPRQRRRSKCTESHPGSEAGHCQAARRRRKLVDHQLAALGGPQDSLDPSTTEQRGGESPLPSRCRQGDSGQAQQAATARRHPDETRPEQAAAQRRGFDRRQPAHDLLNRITRRSAAPDPFRRGGADLHSNLRNFVDCTANSLCEHAPRGTRAHCPETAS